MTYTAKAGLASTRGLQDSYYNRAHGLKKNRNIKRREMEAVSQGSESYNLGSEISPLLHIRFYCNTATHPFVYELSMAAFMLPTGRLVVTEAIWLAKPEISALLPFYRKNLLTSDLKDSIKYRILSPKPRVSNLVSLGRN